MRVESARVILNAILCCRQAFLPPNCHLITGPRSGAVALLLWRRLRISLIVVVTSVVPLVIRALLGRSTVVHRLLLLLLLRMIVIGTTVGIITAIAILRVGPLVCLFLFNYGPTLDFGFINTPSDTITDGNKTFSSSCGNLDGVSFHWNNNKVVPGLVVIHCARHTVTAQEKLRIVQAELFDLDGHLRFAGLDLLHGNVVLSLCEYIKYKEGVI